MGQQRERVERELAKCERELEMWQKGTEEGDVEKDFGRPFYGFMLWPQL